MEKKFKIILDNHPKENGDITNRIKNSIKNQADSILAKILVFVYEYRVCSMTELTNLLVDYFKKPIDRSNVYKYTRTLTNWGLINFYDSGFVLSSSKNNDLIKEIRNKHSKFLNSVPSQFQKKFSNVKYYYVTKYGEEFIEWSAKCLNLKMEQNG